MKNKPLLTVASLLAESINRLSLFLKTIRASANQVARDTTFISIDSDERKTVTVFMKGRASVSVLAKGSRLEEKTSFRCFSG